MHAIPKDAIVAVIGCGAMGVGIAQVAAAAGHQVLLYDARSSAVEQAIDAIGQALERLVDKGRMGAVESDLARERLHCVTDMEQLGEAALVIEAIVEDVEAKRTLFVELETIVDARCILATNTSSISVTAIGAPLQHPERLVGMHFFNPVPVMALVEVVSGLATDASVAEAVYATAERWGKQAVFAKSTPGFIVNRVARPFYAEALRLLQEQAADVATLDAVMVECGGFRMGPFALMDLIGHDINYSVTRSVFAAYYNDPRYTPSIIQHELVSAGFLGRKSGRGFYDYGDAAPATSARCEPMRARPHQLSWTGANGPLDALFQPLLARLAKADFQVQQQAPAPGRAPALLCDGAAIYLTDGRSATERAHLDGHPDTVVFDLLLDPAKARRIALARADQCSEAGWNAVVGLFQAAGFEVTALDDVPGMMVMRTVAMLANEAADAVYQGVCSAQAVDTAMQKGVNYPRGPLAWMDAIGMQQVVSVLSNLAASYGEDRYRVSPLLRRKLASASAPLMLEKP